MFGTQVQILGTPNVNVLNVNANGQANMLNSSPVVIASDQPALPTNATPINGNGTATAGTATATLAANATQYTWLTLIVITIIDTATAGSAELSVTGLAGGTVVFEINAQGTVGVEAPIIIPFPTAQRSSAQNTSIVATLPTLGASTGKVSVALFGYQL